jgi:DNA gyrase subunit A
MRMNEVPASTGYGEPITKFFNLDDQVRIIGAVTTDERFVPTETKPKRGDPPGPYILAATSTGLVLRTPLAPYREASTRNGRRFCRLDVGAKVVLATVPLEETSLFLASRGGHVIHFDLAEVNVLSGVGKGVIGIKLKGDDACLGGALCGSRHDALVVETSGGVSKEIRRGAYPATSRGGKGYEIVKRADLVRVLPAPIQLVDWEQFEDQPPKSVRNGAGKNGHGGKSLF